MLLPRMLLLVFIVAAAGCGGDSAVKPDENESPASSTGMRHRIVFVPHP